MSKPLETQIVNYLKTAPPRPLKPRRLARALNVEESEYGSFREALRQLMHEGRVVLGSRGAVVLPTQKQADDVIVGSYRHNRRSFGFVIPSDPASHEDLFIPEGENGGAITGDVVRAKITSRGQRDGKAMYTGRIMEIVERTHTRFVGTLLRQHNQWLVFPDGNALTEPILAPDAASRHLKAGTKVVIELTTFPGQGQPAEGVITEVLGKAGEKDVDLKSVIVQFNLPGPFPEPVLAEAREAIARFNRSHEWGQRRDLSDQVICTIDPDDAKDYDDAISLVRTPDGLWELGVHIADVSYFVPAGSALDQEGQKRGNSCYFPGHVIPMLPEILSNGVCSLQEDVPRLCKSAFIRIDEDGRPVSADFANTIIKSRQRLRYREAQALIDGAQVIPHPDGDRRAGDYPKEVLDLLKAMNHLARKIQKRRRAAGQIVLDLPEIELVLDQEGRVTGTRQEDTSFTHTIIEMFMVEANEAVARLLDGLNVPFLRRIHPLPEADSSERLQHFVQVAGYRLPREMTRQQIQSLLDTVKGRPEAFAINLAILKSLSRAEYSPQQIGHYALASEHYSHFTSPIRRYADLTVHRLLDSYFTAMARAGHRRRKPELEDVISYDDLVQLGRQLSFTERRAEDAERDLNKTKVLELLSNRLGDVFDGVVTGITNFGIFIQIREYLIDGLIRYESLMDDWWDVDERGGFVRGQRTGRKIGIGDPVSVIVARVDLPRRELDLVIKDHQARGQAGEKPARPKPPQRAEKRRPQHPVGGRRQSKRRR